MFIAICEQRMCSDLCGKKSKCRSQNDSLLFYVKVRSPNFHLVCELLSHQYQTFKSLMMILWISKSEKEALIKGNNNLYL